MNNDTQKNPAPDTLSSDATPAASAKKFLEFSKLFSSASTDSEAHTIPENAQNTGDALSASAIPQKKDILLNKDDVYAKTPVRDPLFAAKILEEEQKPYAPSTEIPVREEIPIPTRIEPEEKILKPLRTYQGDVAETLKKQKTSVVQMVLAEHDKKERFKEESRATSKRNLPLIVISVVFALVGIGALGGGTFYFINKRSAQTPVEPIAVSSIIFAETAKEISIDERTPDSLARTISAEVSSARLRLDTIENVYFTKQIGDTPTNITARISVQEFFTALNSVIPDALLRSFDSDFMFGIHAFNGNEPFIILKTNFFENSFSGMLKWEERMGRELFPLFGSPVNDALSDKKFQDIVIKNRDLRALLNENKDIVLLYTFYDRNTIIITRTISTMDEVVSRLTRPKQ